MRHGSRKFDNFLLTTILLLRKMSNILEITDADYEIFYSNDTSNLIAYRLCLFNYLHLIKSITNINDKIKAAEQIFIILDTPCGHSILKTDIIFRSVVLLKFQEMRYNLQYFKHIDIHNILFAITKVEPVFSNIDNIDYTNYTWLYKYQIRV